MKHFIFLFQSSNGVAKDNNFFYIETSPHIIQNMII